MGEVISLDKLRAFVEELLADGKAVRHISLAVTNKVNRPGFDGGSVYWFPTSDWLVCWAA